ncbi:MAG TPA: class I SAM-dependent methyltransferase [Solirubrobacterales bacterium]|nr:class I SAM-dependent methyltransferase [Solirubrobacterales bacterium]
MPASPTATAAEIKDANTRYHDAAASSYDAKWGIDFGPTGQRQVRSKLIKALGSEPESRFDDALEIGAGTGYFSLNLLQRGLVERATASDISPGMLSMLAETAGRLGLDVTTAEAEAEELPFTDASFDLVFGHAVLHHIPDLDRAFAEFRRVLRPGGTIAFCGEPSRYGDRLATLPKRGGALVAPAWRLLVGAGPGRGHDGNGGGGHELESEVDVHAFAPGELRAAAARAGLEAVRVRGEELLANAYGWLLRTLEGSAEPDRVPRRWRTFAFRSYIALQRLDAAVLEPRLPPALFYNLVLSGRAPGGGA